MSNHNLYIVVSVNTDFVKIIKLGIATNIKHILIQEKNLLCPLKKVKIINFNINNNISLIKYERELKRLLWTYQIYDKTYSYNHLFDIIKQIDKWLLEKDVKINYIHNTNLRQINQYLDNMFIIKSSFRNMLDDKERIQKLEQHNNKLIDKLKQMYNQKNLLEMELSFNNNTI